MTHEPQTIRCRVVKLIAKRLGMDPADVTENRTLHALGIDDLTKIEIGLDIEDLFDAEASDQAHESVRTIGDFVALAESLVTDPVS